MFFKKKNKLEKRVKTKRELFVEYLKKFFLWLLGTFIVAVALELFLLPNKIIDGGVIGISMMVSYITKQNLGLLILLINIPFILFALKSLGKRFVINTFIATVMLAVATNITTHYGAVTNGTPSESNMSSTYTESEDGSVVQTNTTVTENDSMTVVTTIEHSYVKDSEQTGTYDIDIKVSLEDKNSWTDAKNTVNQILKSTNATLSDQAGTIDTDVIVYVKEGSLDNNFLADMANRDMTLTVVTPNGSTWRVDCSETKKTDIVGKTDYSYTVEEASGNSRDKLGTDDCYKVTFTESAKLNAEVIIKLPQSETNSNAFLYQVEKDGTHTRLQAVAVDNSGNAHFYLASVNDKTEYVIGVNVPNEKTDDVIIPDELLAQYGAIERLEEIEYVTTGLESSWGLGFKQVTWIMIGVLVGCAVVVGVFMGLMNKRKQKKIMSGGN